MTSGFLFGSCVVQDIARALCPSLLFVPVPIPALWLLTFGSSFGSCVSQDAATDCCPSVPFSYVPFPALMLLTSGPSSAPAPRRMAPVRVATECPSRLRRSRRCSGSRARPV
eukprot:1242603-Pyramimonas_sp.AAC.1